MSCSDTPVKLMPVAEALQCILQNAIDIREMQSVTLDEADGRVLAEPVCSAINVPAWDNSAMDGYAIRFSDLDDNDELPVAQTIPAGTTGRPHQPGTASRIFTGAPVPEGADTVVMQEMVERKGDVISINGKVVPGSNIRSAGEDIQQGSIILESGTALGPQHVGLAASVGIDKLVVRRKLKVAMFTTGDELVDPGEKLAAGKIYNSNRFLFSGLLRRLGCELIDLGNVADDFQQTCQTLESAAEQSDLIISSGGVSVGDEDHVRNALETIGELELWRIAVRPGKPLAFGKVNEVPFIGVPGNPVSLFVTFCLFVRPFILKHLGVSDLSVKECMMPAAFDWVKPDSRAEYMRARIVDDQGMSVVELHPSRSSGVLSSVTWADGLVAIEPRQVIHKGDKVRFIPFTSLF
jgi:molybdopterin molybdotransferase